ncbi:MAG: ParA family protein [Actinomycetota bacterium]
MRTVAVISHKGGAGKTSSAVMLAEDMAARGMRVVLIDADRQRGAGLLLGLEQPGQTVQQTQHPRLRYYCCSGVPLRELPAKAAELAGLFDLAVVDTPSLDDPLARAWMQLSTAAVMLIPIEPVSLKTLEGAESALEAAKRLNPGIQLLGILPTMFDASDTNQRTLMLELRARSPDTVLSEAIPFDRELAQRAAQSPARVATPADATRAAYHNAAGHILDALEKERAYEPEPVAERPRAPAARGAGVGSPAAAAVTAPVPAAEVKRPARTISPVSIAAVVLVVVLLLLGLSWIFRQNRAGSLPASQHSTRLVIATFDPKTPPQG